jgi:hypothetical protein
VSAAAPRPGNGTSLGTGANVAASTRMARLPPAWTITTALTVVYLIIAPQSPDLAAASYRSDLFSRLGFTLWDNSWYGGHHLLAYSLLAPALGALIGPQTLAAISMILATALFAKVIDGRFPTRATRIAAIFFALGASVSLLSSRVPFDLGLAIGLGTVLLVRRGRLALALVLSVLTALASPVAGAFLALAFLAWALAGPARGWPLTLTVAALMPIAVLTLAFPEGGVQPFVASAYFPDLLAVLLLAALMRSEPAPFATRVLRIGTLLYALALTGSYLIPTAVGGNVDRLGALVAGPVAACVLAGRTRMRLRALIVLSPFLFYWQATAPATDFASTLSNRSVNASFYEPLIDELRTLGIGYGARPTRIEVVATADHWEARYVAPHVMIARGWERQLDTYRNGLFYEESKPLTAQRYRTWLEQNAISYIALPNAPLDYSARSEARLLRSGRASYLHEIWRSAHWRLFSVADAAPLASPPGILDSAGSDSFTLYAPRAGTYTVKVRFTSYWALSGGSGCVAEAPAGWTEIQAHQTGRFHVVIRFSPARIFSQAPRCS